MTVTLGSLLRQRHGWRRAAMLALASASASAAMAASPDRAKPPVPAGRADTAITQPAPRLRPGKPNILWICTDQQRWDIFDPHAPLDPPGDFAARYDLDAIPPPLWNDSDLAEKAAFEGIMFQTKVTKPRSAQDKLDKAKYWAKIEMIDENVGRLLKRLEDSGQADQTVVIFTSDHGEMLGDHGLWWKGCRFYEGLMRVPLVFWAPKRFRQDLRSHALVDLMDIAPTLMELAGESVPKRMQGKSLLPILKGTSAPDRHKDYIRGEFYACLGPDEGSKEWPENRATMIRIEDYKLVVYHEHEKGELFNLKNDPNEFVNLWDDPKFKDERFMLLKKSFDSTVESINAGPERIGRY